MRTILHAVKHHLAHDGERKRKSEGGNHRAVNIVGIRNADAAHFSQIDTEILPAVIIVDGICSIPDVFRGEGCTSIHCGHKAVIHELLRSACLRPEADEISPEHEESEEQHLLRNDQINVHLFLHRLQHEQYPAHADKDQRDNQRPAAGKPENIRKPENPDRISACREPDHPGEQPSTVTKCREQNSGQRKKSGPDDQKQQIPPEKRKKAAAKKRARRRKHKEKDGKEADRRVFHLRKQSVVLRKIFFRI